MSAAIGLLPISVAYNLRGFMSTSVELIVYFRKRAEEGQLIDDIRDRVRQLIVYYCTPSMDLGERKDRIDIIEHLAHGLLYSMQSAPSEKTLLGRSEEKIVLSLKGNHSNNVLEASSARNSTPDSLEFLEESDSDFIELNRMIEAEHAAVLFSGILESYPTDSEIDCHFVTKSITPQHGDRIGIFKMGFKSVDECIQWKDVSECDQSKFSACILSEDASSEGEFYQFCYIRADGEICGASNPFRVYRPTEDDFVQLQNKPASNDEEDFVVIKSHQALLQERYSEVKSNNRRLELEKMTLTEKLNAMEDELRRVRAAKESIAANLEALQSEYDCMNSLITTKNNQFEKELQEAVAAKANSDAEVETLKKELRQVMTRVQTCELQFNEALEDNEQKIRRYESIIAEKNIEIENSRKNLLVLQEEHRDLVSRFTKIGNEKSFLQSENNKLRSELEDTRARLQALLENNKLLHEELKSLENQKKTTENQKKKMEDDLNTVRANLESLKLTNQGKTDEIKNERLSWQAKESKFQKQIDELTARLAKAAEEYQNLYKRNAKTESKLQKLESKIETYLAKKAVSNQSEDSSDQTEVKRIFHQELLDAKNATDDDDVKLVCLPCVHCKENIQCLLTDYHPMLNHLEEVHNQRLCPVCSAAFDTKMAGFDKYFQAHVEDHFNRSSYPFPAPNPFMEPFD